MSDRTDLCCAAVFVPVVLAGHVLLDGWVLSWLWEWFAVPLGAKSLGWAHMAGLALIATMLTRRYRPSPRDESEHERARFVAFLVAVPLLSLLVGWLLLQVIS